MKKILLLSVSMLAFGLLTSCGGGAGKIVPNQMTMTSTAKGDVKINIGGEGDAVIDWGDGSEKETITLQRTWTSCKHTFADDTERIIRITGENITFFSCGEDLKLSTLDVSRILPLKSLSCNSNNLAVLDLSANAELTDIFCPYNQLTVFDLSKNTALARLECFSNKLTALDLSKNTELKKLDCSKNPLGSIDLSTNSKLESIRCEDNALTAEALNALFKSLHGNEIEGKKIYIAKNPGTNDCDQSIATEKGWIVNK